VTLVTVLYDGGLDPELDRKVRVAATATAGRECGSGCALVPPFTRDLDFEFSDRWRAGWFIHLLPPETRSLWE